jgi:hypothetical protein
MRAAISFAAAIPLFHVTIRSINAGFIPFRRAPRSSQGEPNADPAVAPSDRGAPDPLQAFALESKHPLMQDCAIQQLSSAFPVEAVSLFPAARRWWSGWDAQASALRL